MKYVKKPQVKKRNRKENNRLKYLLHQKTAEFREQRSINTLHASDLTKKDFCPARIALMRLHKVKLKKEFIATSTRVTYDYGTFLEGAIVDYLGDSVVGDWECDVFHPTKMQKRPKFCDYTHPDWKGKPSCGRLIARYKEPRWIDEETELSCGTDFFVDIGEDKPILVELKSLKAADFRTISRPRKEHLLRTNLYLHILKRSGTIEVNVDEAIVLYTCKGYGFADDFVRESDLMDAPFSPFKEFIVKREDNEEIDRMFMDALAIKESTLESPPRKVCSNSHCAQAKACEVREECFG